MRVMSVNATKVSAWVFSLGLAGGLIALAPMSRAAATQDGGMTATNAASLYIQPSDDVWVYPHAGNASTDEYLRTWGSGGEATGDAAEEGGFSYSYIKWDLTGLPKDAKISEAKIMLTHVPDPEFTLSDAKSHPIQIRGLVGNFTEKTWRFDNVATVKPEAGDKGKFGEGAPLQMPMGKEFQIYVDLLKGPGDFRAYFDKALKGAKPELSLAVTSAIDPAELGQAGVYKVYSRNANNTKFRPVLMLWFEK
jgi:hypothetical protein